MNSAPVLHYMILPEQDWGEEEFEGEDKSGVEIEFIGILPPKPSEIIVSNLPVITSSCNKNVAGILRDWHI